MKQQEFSNNSPCLSFSLRIIKPCIPFPSPIHKQQRFSYKSLSLSLSLNLRFLRNDDGAGSRHDHEKDLNNSTHISEELREGRASDGNIGYKEDEEKRENAENALIRRHRGPCLVQHFRQMRRITTRRWVELRVGGMIFHE